MCGRERFNFHPPPPTPPRHHPSTQSQTMGASPPPLPMSRIVGIRNNFRPPKVYTGVVETGGIVFSRGSRDCGCCCSYCGFLGGCCGGFRGGSFDGLCGCSFDGRGGGVVPCRSCCCSSSSPCWGCSCCWGCSASSAQLSAISSAGRPVEDDGDGAVLEDGPVSGDGPIFDDDLVVDESPSAAFLPPVLPVGPFTKRFCFLTNPLKNDIYPFDDVISPYLHQLARKQLSAGW